MMGEMKKSQSNTVIDPEEDIFQIDKKDVSFANGLSVHKNESEELVRNETGQTVSTNLSIFSKRVKLDEKYINFYVEEASFIPGSRLEKGKYLKTALIDFENFSSIQNIELANTNNFDDSKLTSMLAVTYSHKAYEGLRSNCWYSVPMSLFANDLVEYNPYIEGGGGELFLRSNLSLGSQYIDFSRYRTNSLFMGTDYVVFNEEFQLEGALELVVVNCGQGNWNEIHSKDFVLIYDIGASKTYNKSEINELVKSRRVSTKDKQKVIFISHWDVDHYQSILAYEDEDYDKLQAVIGPDVIPKTATYERVKNTLKYHDIELFTMPPSERDPGDRGRRINLKFRSKLGPFDIFRSNRGISRNKSGIVIVVNGNDNMAILTGDHHYTQILNAVNGRRWWRAQEVILVAPHHGGNAGKLDVRRWCKTFGKVQTAISVGENHYGHPTHDNLWNLSWLGECRFTDFEDNLHYDI